MPPMRILPLLKYKAAERLRFGGSLSRSGPEIEPHGGYSRRGPKPPWPVKIGARMLEQGVRVVVRIAIGGRFAPNPPLPAPTFSPAAMVCPLLGGKQPLLLPRICSDTLAREFMILLGLASLRLSSPPRGCGRGSVRRSLPGPGPTRAPRSGGGGSMFAMVRLVPPWVPWGPWPPWLSAVHSGITKGFWLNFLRLVQPWVSWGPRPPWPSWVHSVGRTKLLLLQASVAASHWASRRPELPWPCWRSFDNTTWAFSSSQHGMVRPWVSWGPWPPWPSWVHSFGPPIRNR